MATHFICQSTEPLPHNYTLRLGRNSHGAVSQYEVFNAGQKPHTTFPPPGWDFSQSSEDDSLPLLHPAPQPELKSSSIQYDPDLCITPQKGKVCSNRDVSSSENKVNTVQKYEPDPDLTLTPLKGLDENLRPSIRPDNTNDKGKKQKVRFELDGSVTEHNVNIQYSPKAAPEKLYKPEQYGDDADDEFDLENTDKEIFRVDKEKSCHARTVKYTVGQANDQAVYVPMCDSDEKKNGKEILVNEDETNVNKQAHKSAKSTARTQTVGEKVVKVVREKPGQKHESANVISDPIAACKVPESSGTKRRVKVLRENQYTPKETEYTYPFSENGLEDYGAGDEHMFARPEYNSTLRMKLEAEKLKECSLDIQTALERKLRVSDSTKTEINEKAASLVNTGGSAFSGLVSLDVPTDELCRQAIEMKTARAKQVKLPKSKFKDHREPDLMEFFSSERQKESVTFSLPGISAPSEHLSTASNWRAFDLYKHNRVWEKSGKL